jgi:tetratricopeptide (TPR) repeat protein
MALDVYQTCLGGMDKKIKFCPCGKDMLSDLNKVVDAINGGQRAGALSHISRLLESNGHRACLLALKGMLQFRLNDFEGLATTAEDFLQAHPENPVAAAMSAIVAAGQGDQEAAVEHLQLAFQESPSAIHEMVHEALGVVANLLLQTHHFLAARAHLSLLAGIHRHDEHNEALEMLVQMNAAPAIALLLKQRHELAAPAADVLWRDACEAALELVARGAWAEALKRFRVLGEELPSEATVWKNIAVLHGYLGRHEGAAAAWHTYAGLDGVDLEDAVEAEALAQLLESEDPETIEEVTRTYPISDTDRVMERLLSERHVDRMPGDLSLLGTEDSPPPKAAFWLLDRAVPTSAQGLKHEDIPNVLGEMYVYGRETDREARIEFTTIKTHDFETKIQVLTDLLGEFGGDLVNEETAGEMPAAAAALTWRWRLPDETTREQRAALMEEKRRQVNLNVWPETPHDRLAGKRPSEAASDPHHRVPLLAVILLLELAGEQENSPFDFDELRAKLGLPTRTDVEPDGLDIREIPLTRLHLLSPEGLSDEDLLAAYGRAWMCRAPRAIRRLGTEILARPSLHAHVELDEVYHALSTVARNVDEALQHNQQAQRAATANHKSPARWLLRELDLRLMRGEPHECQRIIARLRASHGNEPGVMESLFAWLVQIGAITPDGRPADAGAPVPEEGSTVAAGVPAEPTGGGIVMPGPETKPTPAKEKPSIWLPGME